MITYRSVPFKHGCACGSCSVTSHEDCTALEYGVTTERPVSGDEINALEVRLLLLSASILSSLWNKLKLRTYYQDIFY